MQVPGEAAQMAMLIMSDLHFAPFLLILITNYNGNIGTTGVEHEDLPEDVGVVAPLCLH